MSLAARVCESRGIGTIVDRCIPKTQAPQNQLFLKTVIYIKCHTISFNGTAYNMKIESQIELLREKIIEDDFLEGRMENQYPPLHLMREIKLPVFVIQLEI